MNGRIVRSKNLPGLMVRRQGFDLTFNYGEAWETWSAKTGQILDFGGPDMPDDVKRYVRERVTELLPPHRRQLVASDPGQVANKMTAPTANQEAVKDTPQEAFLAPIVGAAMPTVKENDPTMIDFSNPQAVAKASAIALKIKAALGIPELEARRADLRSQNRDVEIAYRNAKAAKNEAKRLLDDADTAMKAREQELVIEAAGVIGEDGKKRFTTVDAQKAGAVAMRKTDAEYLALNEARLKAAQAHYEAEQAEAHAKAEQKALVREFDLLVADLALATARIEAFAGLDAEPTTTAA